MRPMVSMQVWSVSSNIRSTTKARAARAAARYMADAADDGLAGIQQLAGGATLLYYQTDEAQEGRDAYVNKRRPDFDQFPKRP